MKRFIVLFLLLLVLFTGIACGEDFYRPSWISSAFTVPECVDVVGAGAFEGDTSLTQVVITDSTESIGANAFAGCTSLERIAVYSRTIQLAEGALGTANEVKEIWAPGGSTAEAYANKYGYEFYRIPLDATDLLEYAATLLGTPYVHGKTDCIMFVRECYLHVFGVELPATCTAAQNLSTNSTFKKSGWSATKITSVSDLQPGDIICWNDEKVSYCTHVGIYVGNGRFIESSSSAGHVQYNSFGVSTASYTSYYIRTFMHAWRIL